MKRRPFTTRALCGVFGFAALSGGSAPAAPPAPATTAASPEGGLVQDWFIFLERGQPAPPAELEAMQRAHIDNFKRLFGLGLLLAAGPLQDPTGHKRGIVVARAPSRAALDALFLPDDYVRGGHMTLNASPCLARRPLNTVGVVPESIEESRITLLGRAAPGAATSAERTAQLQTAVNRGRIGAWYTLATGPVAEVLLTSVTHAEALRSELADWPGLDSPGTAPPVWPQWLSKGVLPA
jgi:uncharacterized protein YciI